MANILKKVMDAITPKAPDTLAVFAERFAKEAGIEYVSTGELRKMREIDKKWWDAWRDRNEKFTSAAAKAEWRKQIAAGHAESPEGIEIIESKYAAASLQAEAMMKACNESAVALVKTALTNFIGAGENWIQRRADSEKSEAAEFGVNFIPSPVLVAAQRIVATHRIRLQNVSTSTSASPVCHLVFLKL